jgi:hypothetical protein
MRMDQLTASELAEAIESAEFLTCHLREAMGPELFAKLDSFNADLLRHSEDRATDASLDPPRACVARAR